MRNIVAATGFRIIQIVLSPIALVGYAIFITKMIMYTRTSGASATALGPLYARWMQHKLGTRLDAALDRHLADVD